MIPCRQSCTLSVGHATPIFECKINTFLALWTNFKPGASNLSVKPSITSCGIKETHQSFCSTDNGIGIYTMMCTSVAWCYRLEVKYGVEHMHACYSLRHAEVDF